MKCVLDVGVGCSAPNIQILSHGAGKEDWVLREGDDAGAEAEKMDVGNGNVGDGDLAGGWGEEIEEGEKEGGFAAG